MNKNLKEKTEVWKTGNRRQRSEVRGQRSVSRGEEWGDKERRRRRDLGWRMSDCVLKRQEGAGSRKNCMNGLLE